MSKALFAALLAGRPDRRAAAGADADRRGANHAAGRAGQEASQDEEAADAGPARRARAAEEVRRRMEGSQGRRQDREGNEVAEILERLQQAPQGGRLKKLNARVIGALDRHRQKKPRASRGNRVALVTP